jgi:hypothetical protein
MEMMERLMRTLRHKFIVGAARLFSLITGDRVILFHISPREGGYHFVRSADLPGFTMMLEPGEADSLKSIMDALYEPVMAYLEAESRGQWHARPVVFTRSDKLDRMGCFAV